MVALLSSGVSILSILFSSGQFCVITHVSGLKTASCGCQSRLSMPSKQIDRLWGYALLAALQGRIDLCSSCA